jgi:arginyl-tRNA synthetase
MEPSKHVMKSILKQVIGVTTQTIKAGFDVADEGVVAPLTNKPGLDYQIPTVIKLFNRYKKSHNSFGAKNLKELAEQFQSKLVDNEVVDSLEINDEGFVFAHVRDTYIEQEINNILNFGINIQQEQPQTLVVDFSSPNIAKEMHVGHLRSTILGESICRILELQGHKVHRVNHLGDWGTQFGMLITHLKEAFPNYMTELPPLSDLTAFYKEAKNKFDLDADFKKKSQLTTVDLQQGDADCRKAWEALCQISFNEFNKIYKRLDITVENFGESFYNPMIPGVIKEIEDKGLIELSEGAKCMFIKGKQVPLMLQKSDGGYNYDSTDMAAAKYRLLDLHADRILILTDVGQRPHFDLIFEGAKMMGWHQPPKTRMEHMGFGLVTDKDGQKFKTRSGDTVKLIDLLDEGKQRAADQLRSRLTENKEGNQTLVNEAEVEESAERIGMAAIKYFDLKQNRISNYKFNYDQMLDPKGNTAVYLLYSYARICSIINKSGVSEEEMKAILNKGGFKITHPHERTLAMCLLRFPEVIDTVTEELNIHKLCDFIYEVSTKVAEGYSKYRINDDPNKETRILLCVAVKRIMDTAFNLVGIKPLEKI